MFKIIFNKYTLFQLLELIALMFVSFVLVFILVHIMPGATAKLSNSSIPPEQQRALIIQYGLDKPLITQFFVYVRNIFLHLDFGISISVRPNDLVVNVIGEKIGLSLIMGSFAIIIAFIFGYLIGLFLGMNNKRILGGVSNGLISFLLALPSFLIGTLIVYFASVTGGSSNVLFNYNNPATWVLPILTLAIPQSMLVATFVSSEVIRHNNEQYIKFAKAKGLLTRQIIFKHLFKPSIFSTITLLTSSFLGTIISGLFTDAIFSVPGIGSVLSQAIGGKDYDIIQTLILFFTFATSILFWLRDILYVFADPRILTRI